MDVVPMVGNADAGNAPPRGNWEPKLALTVAALSVAFAVLSFLLNAQITCLMMLPGPEFYHRHAAFVSVLGALGAFLGGRALLLARRGIRARRAVILAHTASACSLFLAAAFLAAIVWHSRNAMCGFWPLG